MNLGDIRLKSEPGAPLEAEISVSDVAADEQASLSVGLADAEGFRWAGIEWSPQLGRLQFDVQRGADGTQSIRIHTTDAPDVSRLHFLLKVAWPRGRVFREYLLELEQAPGPAAERQVEPTSQPDALVVTREPDDGWAGAREAARQHNNYEVIWGDTLWEIARELRPHSSVTIHQMMLALLRANPEAFSRDNVNWLKAGSVLRMPGALELQALSAAQAYAEVLTQNNVWRQTRGYPTVATRPQTAAGTAAADAELRLAPVSDEDLESERAAAAGSTQSGDLAQASKQVEELARRNVELEDKLSQTESAIDDLRRLVELKDDELAALQEQRIRTGAEPGPGLLQRLQSLFKTIGEMIEGRWWVTLVAPAALVILVLGWLLRRKSGYNKGFTVPAASIRPDFLRVARGENTAGEAGQEDGEQGHEEDDVRNKIELAKAYLDLGDTENVRSILDEALAEGNAAQREEARQLLERVNSRQ